MQAGHRFRRRRLDRVGNGEQPEELLTPGQVHDAAAPLALGLAGCDERADFHAFLPHQHRVAQCQALAVDDSSHADAGRGVEVLDPGQLESSPARGFHDRRRKRVLAALVEARSQAQHVAIVEARRGDGLFECGLAFGSVPVLSTIIVSRRRKFSMAEASRNRMPCVAAAPDATMTDIGVARPSAQGQAMISTATAFTIA